ncbi:MAG: hypothetical protein HYW65_01575 [Candidatus Liptonbacteria bacterium]|nr:hypothetical protein [Candidatus Liptonbacteria bacterium]
MKGLLILILILLLVGAAIYFLPAWTSSAPAGAKSNPFSLLRNSAVSSSQTVSSALQENILVPLTKGAGKIVSSTQSAITGKAEAVGGAISQTFSDAVQGIAENAKEGIAGALGITPADSGELLAADQLVNLSICSTVKSTSVTYAIQNPFSPPQDFSFRIDWGDGGNSQGALRASDTRTSATHHYEKSGNYVNTFTITSQNPQITLKRKVCIE